MNTARLTRYDVSASLSASGFSPRSVAIAGSDVVITVESMFSMNNAQATISGMRNARCCTVYRAACSALDVARVEGVAEPITQQIEREHDEEYGRAGPHCHPRRVVDVVLRGVEHAAPA